KPSDTPYFPPASDNGTPFQKDEAQTDQGPSGVYIDYYLGAGTTGTVSIEILDGAGKSLQTFSNAPSAEGPGAATGRGGGPGGASGGIPNTSALWRATPEPFAAGPGMHRVLWAAVEASAGRGRGGRGGTRTPLIGTFTAKLSANGKT